MKNKFILREIKEIPVDIKFEWFKTIKTICTILLIFCFGFIFKKIYYEMVQNTGNMRFYPITTVFYEDFKNQNDFDHNIVLPKNTLNVSYGKFKDKVGNDKYLIVIKTDKIPDKSLTREANYYKFVQNNYIFISDDKDELLELPQRIKHQNYVLFTDKNVKKLIKYLDINRDYTFLISDSDYSNLPFDNNTAVLLNVIFDKTMVQGFKTKSGIKFEGKITYKNQLADIATNLKNIHSIKNRKIVINNFSKNKIALIIGIKDFDIWSNLFIKIAKTLSNNQYSNTIALIQTIFNSDVESDIIRKLNGSAVLYAFNYKNTLHPLVVIETKQDFAEQIRKYFDFLQITNSIKIKEKEFNSKTFNIISSTLYPYNISFGSVDENSFILGYQNTVEHYIENNKQDFDTKDSDIYLYLNLRKTPFFNMNNGFWEKFNNLEVNLYISQFINFSGELYK